MSHSAPAPASFRRVGRYASAAACILVLLALRTPARSEVGFEVTWQVTNGRTCGASLAGLGDVNGDGYADLLVAAPFSGASGPRPGQAFLYLGGPAGPATTPVAEWQGSLDGAELGAALGAAGDVDGDGFRDWLIGAPGAADAAIAGEVWVCHGSPGPAATACRTRLTGAVGERFGAAVAAAGDVNGDGYGDVLVGAPDAGTAAAAGRGRVALYLGGPGGLTTAPAWTLSGSTRAAACGQALLGLPDVNGDGRADVLIGAPGTLVGGLRSGRVDLYLGTADGLNPTPAWTVRGEQPRASFGAALALAGDVDRDGFGDLLVGAPNAAGTALDQGRAYLYRGGARGFAPTPAWSARGAGRGALLGFALAGPGDLTGDGYPDVAVGAPGLQTPIYAARGAVQVFAGGPGGLASAPIWTGDAFPDATYYGYAVAAAGDTDGDGRPELAVGAPYWPVDTRESGRALLLRAIPLPLPARPDWQVMGGPSSDRFGAAVATAGDGDGDGYADVLVGEGCDWDSNECHGQALVFRGGPNGPAATPAWVRTSPFTDDSFGVALAWAGDVNGDGFSDALIGAAYDGQAVDGGGRAELYFGSTQGLSLTAAWVSFGPDLWGLHGYSVAGAGDVNGDGFADVLVAAPYATDGPSEGRVSLYLGSASGPSEAPDWFVAGASRHSGFGLGLAGAGDVNGDGLADVVIGAPDEVAGANRVGRAYLFLGDPDGLADEPSWTAAGPTHHAEFASEIDGVGDVDGDGFGDIVVGARWWSNGQWSEGAILLFRGDPDGLGPEPAVVLESDAAYACFGNVLAPAGDVDGDGRADVLVGVPDLDASDSSTGGVLLIPGAPGGLAASPAWRAFGGLYGENFGSALAGGGDLDGDHWPDVVVGAPGNGRTVAYLARCGRDGDGDGAGDCAEGCPADPLKVAPGACGCGRPDADSDQNGLLDCLEPCLPHGDVNGDGLLTASDAQQAFAAALGLVPLDYRARCAADCTGNGQLTAADAQALFAAALGGSCAAPLGPWW